MRIPKQSAAVKNIAVLLHVPLAASATADLSHASTVVLTQHDFRSKSTTVLP